MFVRPTPTQSNEPSINVRATSEISQSRQIVPLYSSRALQRGITLNCPVIMSPSAAYQHAHTVHGASHFAERWLKAPIRTPFGSSVHGGSGGSFKVKLYGGGSLAPPQSLVLEDLDNDAIMTIGHVSGVAGALLAQCCARIHHVLRPSLEARLVRFVDKGILFNDMQETRTLARQFLQEGFAQKMWIRQAVADQGDGGGVYAVCDGAREACVVKREAGHGGGATYVPIRPSPGSNAMQPTCLARAGRLLLVVYRCSHSVHVFDVEEEAEEEEETQHEVAAVGGHARSGTRTLRSHAILGAQTMRQPSGVATAGERCFVTGGSMVHVFDLASGACVDCWPTMTAEGTLIECGHGVALHQGRLLIVHLRGARVHAFSPSGEHLSSFGGYGSTPGRFIRPWGVASCGRHILVSEEGGKRVQAFSADGEVVGHAAPAGWGSLAGISACVGPGGEARVLVADWDRHCVHVLEMKAWY